MKTTEQPNTQNYQKKFSKVKFLEYSTANHGQHLITVLHGKTIIGRIYRAFDTATQKPLYTANDEQSNPIYTEEQTLAGLKKSFVQTQREKSQEQETTRDNSNIDKEPSELIKPNPTTTREVEIQKVRNKINTPDKGNEINR